MVKAERLDKEVIAMRAQHTNVGSSFSYNKPFHNPLLQIANATIAQLERSKNSETISVNIPVFWANSRTSSIEET